MFSFLMVKHHSWESEVSFNRKTEEITSNYSLQDAVSTSAMSDLSLSGGQQPKKEQDIVF